MRRDLRRIFHAGHGARDEQTTIPFRIESPTRSPKAATKYVDSKATKARIEAVVEEGYTQIDKYASDKDIVQMLTLGRGLKAGVLVFVGLKDVFFREWPRPTREKKTKTTKTNARAKKAGATVARGKKTASETVTAKKRKR